MNGTLTDGFNFVSRLTPRKILNATKVVSSFYLSKWTKVPIVWGQPLSISFEPTTHCNLRCPECPSGLRSFTRPTGILDKTIFKKTIDSIYKDLTYLIFYFQGEPYLNPDFLEMVTYASGKGVYTATSTNAHYLDDENAKKTVESGLDRLIISIDGTTQETYEAYRIGGNLDKVIEGTKNIIKWKKRLKSSTPNVIFQFLVVKPNEHQVDEIKTLGKKLGVDEVRFKTAQIYDYENGNPLIPTIDKYSRYRRITPPASAGRSRYGGRRPDPLFTKEGESTRSKNHLPPTPSYQEGESTRSKNHLPPTPSYQEGESTRSKNPRTTHETREKYEIKNELRNHCWKLWNSCVITWDGAVVPCCFDKDANYSMGSLDKTSLREVWNNKQYKEFRSSVLLSRGNIEMCKNCTEGTTVWAN